MGDVDVCVDDVQRHGRTTGTSTVTLTLPGGSLAVQGAGDEDPAVGPTGFVWALTGGTGEYAGADGEVAGTFRPDDAVVRGQR